MLPILLNRSQVGLPTFPDGVTSGSFSAATALRLVPGNVLEMDAPARSDPTLADLVFTLNGVLSS